MIGAPGAESRAPEVRGGQPRSFEDVQVACRDAAPLQRPEKTSGPVACSEFLEQRDRLPRQPDDPGSRIIIRSAEIDHKPASRSNSEPGRFGDSVAGER